METRQKGCFSEWRVWKWHKQEPCLLFTALLEEKMFFHHAPDTVSQSGFNFWTLYKGTIQIKSEMKLKLWIFCVG